MISFSSDLITNKLRFYFSIIVNSYTFIGTISKYFLLFLLLLAIPKKLEVDCIYISRKVSCPFAKNWWNRELELSYPYLELKGSFLIVIGNNFCVKSKLMKAIHILFQGNLFLRKKCEQRIRLYCSRLDFGIDLLPKIKTKPANSSKKVNFNTQNVYFDIF